MSATTRCNRRKRRLKTDRIDALKLLSMLIRYHNAERTVYSVVHVPSLEAEDARHLHRELLTAKADRTRVTNRIKGLLAAQGLCAPPLGRGFTRALLDLRLFDGAPLHPHHAVASVPGHPTIGAPRARSLDFQRHIEAAIACHTAVAGIGYM